MRRSRHRRGADCKVGGCPCCANGVLLPDALRRKGLRLFLAALLSDWSENIIVNYIHEQPRPGDCLRSSLGPSWPALVSGAGGAGCPGLRWLWLAYIAYIYLSILFYLLSILSIYLFIFIYIYIILLDTRLLLLSIGAAGLLWRRLAAQEMTGRGRAGRCADLCGVSADAVRADPWAFAAFRALAALSWWFAGGVLLWLACCGCRWCGPGFWRVALYNLIYNKYNIIIIIYK